MPKNRSSAKTMIFGKKMDFRNKSSFENDFSTKISSFLNDNRTKILSFENDNLKKILDFENDNYTKNSYEINF